MCITRGKISRQIYNIHGYTAQVRNKNKTKKDYTLIRGRSKKLNVESPTQSSNRKSMRVTK